MSGPFHLNELRAAVFSDDHDHRLWLTRIWTRTLPILVVCMFNPSTADGHKDDPTIRNLCKFAKRWGYGGILVINLHSLCSPDPQWITLCNARKPGASWCDAQAEALGTALSIAADNETPVLCAWGALAGPDDVEPFRVAARDLDLICLGLTANGSPKHPMARGKHRIPDDQQPIPYRITGENDE